MADRLGDRLELTPLPPFPRPDMIDVGVGFVESCFPGACFTRLCCQTSRFGRTTGALLLIGRA
jgi:hypothetical protein